MSAVLGIDPGTRKCGYAVIEYAQGEPLALGIVPTETLAEQLDSLSHRFAIRAVALGGGTHTAVVAALVRAAGLPVTVVDERETTLRARARYFAAHPPRGWKRLVPRGMLLPPCPIDDFAALLIAERFLEREKGTAAG
ncbi:MAG TPA: crossover junction endodeoxyribonuclease RuvC [Polyangiaceae bacterium]|jgi:RNase H-fold protein (predicted Holliday junction resolvase)|nr:crossover junction endodeoxyribonuclease RuvC [Polyangiaceae bacterium]